MSKQKDEGQFRKQAKPPTHDEYTREMDERRTRERNPAESAADVSADNRRAELEKMTVQEITDEATGRGLTVPDGLKKAELIDWYAQQA